MKDGVVQAGPAIPGGHADNGDPNEGDDAPDETVKERKIEAKYPGHLWHVDLTWHNEFCPHSTLAGKTPNEVRYHRKPANEEPRIEPRAKWTPKMKCARPHAAIRGDPGDCFVTVL